MKSVTELVVLFREEGLRITPQRRAIFELLTGDGSHPSADEVYRRVTETMPDVSRATVYNTLRELAELGELVPVEGFGDGQTRYDVETGPHHHLFCIRCHALVDLHQEFAGVALPPAAGDGYQILRSQVTFYGICPDCQRRERSDG